MNINKRTISERINVITKKIIVILVIKICTDYR